MANQSKLKDPRYLAKWRSSGAVGTIETAKYRNGRMVKAINNAQGVQIIRDGASVRFIGTFSRGHQSEMALTFSEADNLLNTGLYEIPDGYGKVLIESKMVRIWFKPVQGCDLVCLKPRDFIRKLKKAL